MTNTCVLLYVAYYLVSLVKYLMKVTDIFQHEPGPNSAVNDVAVPYRWLLPTGERAVVRSDLHAEIRHCAHGKTGHAVRLPFDFNLLITVN